MGYLMDRVRAALGLLGPLRAGFRVLLLRLVERFGWKAVLIAAAVLLYAADRYRKWIAVGALLLCAVAWMHAPKQGAAPADGPAGEEPDDTEPEPGEEGLADLIRGLVGDDRGILLTALRQPLQAADTRAVRGLLAGAGIRVREGVRTEAGNGPGVHRDDVPTPSPLPVDPPANPVVAGECANNAANANANNGLRVESREGMTIITDPADRHRAHSLKKP